MDVLSGAGLASLSTNQNHSLEICSLDVNLNKPNCRLVTHQTDVAVKLFLDQETRNRVLHHCTLHGHGKRQVILIFELYRELF